MIEAEALPAIASLSPALVRRAPTLRPAPPRVMLPATIDEAVAEDWGGDLRFFLTCYAAGFIFFLVMLS